MRIVGLVLFFVCMMVANGSNLPSMIDPPSLIITVGGALTLLWFSGTSVTNMFGALFSSDASTDSLNEAAAAWRFAGAVALGSGGIGTLIGAVIMLKNMDDPAAIGPGMAIAMLTLLYAFFIFVIALALQSRLEARAATAS